MITPPFRCPHCGHNPGGAGNAYLYGSPLRVCKKCNQSYVDRRYHEISIDGIRHEDINLTPERFASDRIKGFIFLIIGIVFIIIDFLIASASADFFISMFTYAGAGILVGGIDTLVGGTKRTIEKNRVVLETERQNSIHRLSDPNYVQQLRSIGYSLSCTNCKTELTSYQPYCQSCGHAVTPTTETISIVPSQISPALHKIILIGLTIAIIVFSALLMNG